MNLSVGSASLKATGDLPSRGCKVGRKFLRFEMLILEFTASFVTSLGGDQSPELHFEHDKTLTVHSWRWMLLLLEFLHPGK